MIYKCIKKFTLARELTKDNRFINNKLRVDSNTVWHWVDEQGEIIHVEDKAAKIELFIDRYYFVQHFQRVEGLANA